MLKAFPGADITYTNDVKRQGIVDSWPADVDDSRGPRRLGLGAGVRLRTRVLGIPDSDDSPAVRTGPAGGPPVAARELATARVAPAPACVSVGQAFLRLRSGQVGPPFTVTGAGHGPEVAHPSRARRRPGRPPAAQRPRGQRPQRRDRAHERRRRRRIRRRLRRLPGDARDRSRRRLRGARVHRRARPHRERDGAARRSSRGPSCRAARRRW